MILNIHRLLAIGALMMRRGCRWPRAVASIGLLGMAINDPMTVAQNSMDEIKEAKKEPKQGKRSLVKKWKMEDLEPALEEGLSRRNFDRGKLLYKEALCAACHTFGEEGGNLGPVLTEVAGRFGAYDILVSIIEPSKVIPDAYAAMVIELEDGRILVGPVAFEEDTVQVITDVLNPEQKVAVDREKIVSMEKSPVSPMPANLIDTFRQEEILDLVAFVLSRGDRNHEMFRPADPKKK